MARQKALISAGILILAAATAAGVLGLYSVFSSSDEIPPRYNSAQNPDGDSSPASTSESKTVVGQSQGTELDATPQTPGDSEKNSASPSGASEAQARKKPSSRTDDDEYDDAFGQIIPRDAIRPIYEPKFITGQAAKLDPGELVIGVDINGESKAYPVAPLNFREMVNDVVGGVPLLVSW